MKIRDTVSPHGHVSLEIYQRGQLLRIEHPNLITSAGRDRFARLFGGDPTARPPSQIAIGDNGTVASPADTAIRNALLLPFSAAPAFSGPSVTFQATATEEQGNGLWVREFGLLDAENLLLARWVRPGADLQKASDLRLLVRWTIAF